MNMDMMNIDVAIEEMEAILRYLKQVKEQRAYTMDDMRQARTATLAVVREFMDLRAFGHMPDQRHY